MFRINDKQNDPTSTLVTTQSLSTPELNVSTGEGHGRTVTGEDACCYVISDGVVDCKMCLSHARKRWQDKLRQEEREIANRLLQCLDSALSEGTTLEEISVGSMFSRCR
jgi:hypothetical protein